MSELQGRPLKRKESQRKRRPKRFTVDSYWRHFLAGGVAILSLAVGLGLLWPKVAVQPGRSDFDPANPHPLAFVISNIGFTELRDVQPMIGLCVISLRPVDALHPNLPLCNGPLKARIDYRPWFRKILSMGEQYTIRLDAGGSKDYDNVRLFDFGSGAIPGVEVSIVIHYKPWLSPIFCENKFTFSTRKEENGMLSWNQIRVRR